MTRPATADVHPLAVVSEAASLAPGVSVGPFAVIEGGVTLGPGCVVRPHAHLIGPLTLGVGNQIWTGCVLGGDPQHFGYKGEPTGLEIGDGNSFREGVTVHRGMPLGSGKGLTRIGSRNLFMAGSHVAHDCTVGDDNIFANAAVIGGHVDIADRVLLSGNSAVHQNCRVGRLALLSGTSATTKDIPPFWIMQEIDRVCGVNVIGMRRAGVPANEIMAVRAAFRRIYVERLPIPLALARTEAEAGDLPAVRELVAFIRASKRGICGMYRADERAEHNRAAAAA